MENSKSNEEQTLKRLKKPEEDSAFKSKWHAVYVRMKKLRKPAMTRKIILCCRIY